MKSEHITNWMWRVIYRNIDPHMVSKPSRRYYIHAELERQLCAINDGSLKLENSCITQLEYDEYLSFVIVEIMNS